MSSFRSSHLVLIFLLASSVGFAGSPQNPPGASLVSRSVLISARQAVQEPAAPQENGRLVKQLFWLGTACDEPSSLLLSHLNIEHGLAVHSIATDSPAEKSGIQVYDIVLSVNDRPLRTRYDLYDAVQKSRGNEVEVGILRGGKRFKLQVRPEVKPASLKMQAAVIPLGGAEELTPAETEELLKKIAPEGNLGGKQFLLFRSAVVLGDDSEKEKGVVPEPKQRSGSGAQLQLTFEGIEQEAIILDSAMLDSDQPISGCCHKLIQVIEAEMAEAKNRIADCRRNLEATNDFNDEIKTSDDAMLSEQRYAWMQTIQKNEIRYELLSETRDRLKAKMERQSQPEPSDAPPDQSSRLDSTLEYWS